MATSDPHRARLLLRWLAVLPTALAIAQAAYEIERMILRAREKGATQREIAAILGVSGNRVHQIERKARTRRTGPPVMLLLRDPAMPGKGRRLRDRLTDFAKVGRY